jgi:hypothetical protein
VATAPGPDETFMMKVLGWERIDPKDACSEKEPHTLWFWKNSLQFSRVAQPNGWRLSCGAELECS